MTRFATITFGNWFSRVYLGAVVLTAVAVTLSYATFDAPDANLAGVWLVFVTLPASSLGVAAAGLVPDALGLPVVLAGVVLGALVNAWLLGLMVHATRRAARRRAT
jgi:hypothetical protein